MYLSIPPFFRVQPCYPDTKLYLGPDTKLYPKIFFNQLSQAAKRADKSVPEILDFSRLSQLPQTQYGASLINLIVPTKKQRIKGNQGTNPGLKHAELAITPRNAPYSPFLAIYYKSKQKNKKPLYEVLNSLYAHIGFTRYLFPACLAR